MTSWFIAAILTIQGFTLFTTSAIGRHLMTAQEDINAVVAQLGKAKDEIVAKIADVQAQLDAANVPAEQVDLTALNAAAQALDDIVPDPAPVDPTA
jgi:uncharacterized protein YPO0396